MEEPNKIEIFEPAPSAPEHRRAEVFGGFESPEPEEGFDLRAHWRVLRKRRWSVLSVLLVIFTIVLIGTLKQKPVYRAQAMLEIERQNPEVVSVQELFQLENVSDTYLETQYKILKSESLARRVVGSLRLDQVKEVSPAWHDRTGEKSTPNSQVSDEEPPDGGTMQTIVRNFEDRLRIQPIERSRLVLVSFDSEDPNLAANAVNALASSYIEERLDTRWQATEKARDWLSQQLDDLKIKLEKSEDELQRYAQDNALVFLESEKGTSENFVNERLRELQGELIKAQADRYQKESVYRLVQAGDYGSLPGVVDNALMQNLTLRLSDLQTEFARLSTTYSAEYPKVKQVENQIKQIQGLGEGERKRVADRIANDYSAARRREELVEQALLAQQKQLNQVATKGVQYRILKREVDTNKQLYEGLLARLKEAGVSAGLKASTIRVIDPAVPPTSPVKPRVYLNLALALTFGLCCAVGLAFLQEHLDNTLKTPDDIERTLHLPALAWIPAFESVNGHRNRVYGLQLTAGQGQDGTQKKLSKKPGWHRIDETGPQYSVLREAFHSFRTSVLLSTANQPPRSLLITSAQPGEGKTTISVNLAISLAQLGQRVLLVDGDLRRPNIHKTFHVPPGHGFVSYLTGQQSWQEVVVPTSVPGLDIIPCGPVPPNPAELLFSERARALFVEATQRYAMVILDSPPILNVADSRVLSVLVDGVVIVVRGNETPRELVQRAQAHAEDAGGTVIGVVLNSVDIRRMDDYSYGYSHSYGYPGEAPSQEPQA